MTSRFKVGVALLVGVVVGALGYAVMDRRPSETQAESAQVSGKSPLPEIPISLNYVDRGSGNGYTVQFHNQSQKHLAVLVELENKTFGQRQSLPLQLAPGQMAEIGAAQGWTFVSGEVVSVKLDGHLTRTFQIP